MKNEEKKTTKNKGKKNDTTNKKTTTSKKQSENNKKQGAKPVAQNKKKVEIKELEKEEIIEETIEEEVMEEQEVDIEEEEEVITTEKKGIKKGDIALILGLVITVVLGFFIMTSKSPEPTYELPLTLSGEAGLQQLSYQEYQDKVDNNEAFVVIISRETCSHCVSFLPVAEDFAKEKNVPMYYVDTDTFTSDEWTKFEKSNTFFKRKKGNWGTPTTIVLAGSSSVDYIEGETSKEKLEELYQEYFEMNQE